MILPIVSDKKDMKWCLIPILLGFLAALARAETKNPSPEKFTWWKTGAETPLLVYRVGSFRVNEACFKDQKSCKALSAHLLNPSRKLTETAPRVVAHPADRHCRAIGGESFILKDTSLNQTNYCEMSDGTLVDSWDLYSAFKKRVGGKK